jgi:hypothetical protein
MRQSLALPYTNAQNISKLCEIFSIDDEFILVSNFEESLWDNPI